MNDHRLAFDVLHRHEAEDAAVGGMIAVVAHAEQVVVRHAPHHGVDAIHARLEQHDVLDGADRFDFLHRDVVSAELIRV